MPFILSRVNLVQANPAGAQPLHEPGAKSFPSLRARRITSETYLRRKLDPARIEDGGGLPK